MEQFWGKSEIVNDSHHYLSVWEHSLNVTTVATVWLQERPLLLTQWCQLLGLNPQKDEHRQEALTIAQHALLLHDLGKYDSRFQAKVPGLCKILSGRDLKEQRGAFDHGGWGLHYYSMLKDKGLEGEDDTPEVGDIPWYPIIRAAASHHGSYSPPSHSKLTPGFKNKDSQWMALTMAAIQTHIERAEQLFPLGDRPPQVPRADTVVFLAGLCTICDWLGSHKHKFQLRRTIDDPSLAPKEITPELKQKAREILEENHLLGKYVGDSNNRILRILGNSTYSPRPLQQKILELTLSDSPQLLIIEAPMGEGKTEAAMFAADCLLDKGIVDKLYFGLPTMATSNAMFKRMQDMLGGTNFFDQQSSLVLGHGKRDFHEPFLKSLNPNSEEGDSETKNLSALKACNAFFANSHKRTLLANAGVGTVDQAMSATLGGRHHWVKLFGLTRSVLIIDEVHAYDAYMVRIIERLLAWLRALGTHVILLSATLTTRLKQQLMEAFAGKPLLSEEATYPLITHVHAKNQSFVQSSIPCAHNPKLEKTVNFKWATDEEKTLKSVITFAKKGAQVCLIVNTVKRAQEFYAALKEHPKSTGIELQLFHSRFQLIDRNVKEALVLNTFGDEGRAQRPDHGRILVATQVVEQSLDVCFDVMVSELAPIDLLLQRAGRLHRHQENNIFREGQKWEKPCLFVLSRCEIISEWLADRKIQAKARSVYDAFVLYKTALLFHKNDYGFPVQIPQDIRGLVEAGYSEDNEGVLAEDQERFEDAKKEWNKKSYEQSMSALGGLQVAPDEKARRLKNAKVHASEEAEGASEVDEEELELGSTRLADPSVQVVFVDLQWTLELDGRESNNPKYQAFKRRLQNYSLSVLQSMLCVKGSKQPIQSSALSSAQWPGWKDTLARFEKEFPYEPKPLLLPLPEQSRMPSIYEFPGMTLEYSPDLGLNIIRNE